MPQCVSPVCVVSHAERHLRSVSPSTVAPVCALVSCVIQFCAHVAVEALQMNAGTGLLLSNTSPEGCTAHVFSSSSGTSKEKDSSFHVMVCQVVSHWKASPVWTAHERPPHESQNSRILRLFHTFYCILKLCCFFPPSKWILIQKSDFLPFLSCLQSLLFCPIALSH